MSKRDELIAKYAADLKDKCGVDPDMDLLTKVTVGCTKHTNFAEKLQKQLDIHVTFRYKQ